MIYEHDAVEGFYFKDVLCYPDLDEAGRFYYLPRCPIPDRDSSGRPVLTLWLGESISWLQLGAQWNAEEAALQALPAEIARRFPGRGLSESTIRLTPGQAMVESVRLMIGNGAGQFADLQTSSSSGYPPFSALFNTTLTPEQRSQATGALNGNPDYLKITYFGRIHQSAKGTVQHQASVDLSTWFPAGSGADHIQVMP